jgi:cyclopropane fatty-acyl-phospholipid synthase-like methyltransferase
MITKFKIFEIYNEFDPYNEENWGEVGRQDLVVGDKVECFFKYVTAQGIVKNNTEEYVDLDILGNRGEYRTFRIWDDDIKYKKIEENLISSKKEYYTNLDQLPEPFKTQCKEIVNNINIRKINYRLHGALKYGDMILQDNLFFGKNKLIIGENTILISDELFKSLKYIIKSKMGDKLYKRISHYSDKLWQDTKDPDNPLIVGWYNKKQQESRFENLLKIGFQNGDSIIDYGCGVGDLYGYMKNKYQNFEYVGVDIVDKYINMAKNKFPDARFEIIDSINDIKMKYDWIIASGVFTVFTTTQELISQLKEAYKIVNKGLSFNLVDKNYYPDVQKETERRRGYDKENITRKLNEIFPGKVKTYQQEFKNLKHDMQNAMTNVDSDINVYIYK